MAHLPAYKKLMYSAVVSIIWQHKICAENVHDIIATYIRVWNVPLTFLPYWQQSCSGHVIIKLNYKL
jgi:hypothetical protein